jgi:hypothetical protein
MQVWFNQLPTSPGVLIILFKCFGGPTLKPAEGFGGWNPKACGEKTGGGGTLRLSTYGPQDVHVVWELTLQFLGVI